MSTTWEETQMRCQFYKFLAEGEIPTTSQINKFRYYDFLGNNYKRRPIAYRLWFRDVRVSI